MKRFNEEDSTDIGKNDNNNIETNSYKDLKYKRLDDEKDKNDFITPSMKNFRRIIGVMTLMFMAYNAFFHNAVTTDYRTDLTSGKVLDVKSGDRLSKESASLESKDFDINLSDSYGKVELSIWNFADKEDGDYVQVFVNGSPQTEPFVIKHRPIKVGVPGTENTIIQVRGIKDGSDNGITYGVSFNKTGETYLNTVPLNLDNTYTFKIQ